MDINTKFECYEEIWFISNKKAISSKVKDIKIDVKSISGIEIATNILYVCNEDSTSNIEIKVSEEDAFKTKEELLKSL